jgi:hypothetical protein
MSDEQRDAGRIADGIVESLNNYAANNPCRGDHEGVCIEVVPDVPAQWCAYCLMQASAKALEQLRDEVGMLRDQLKRLGETGGTRPS